MILSAGQGKKSSELQFIKHWIYFKPTVYKFFVFTFLLIQFKYNV